MTTSDYITRAYRPQPGRKYWNHMAEHTPGAWHRHALLSSGQYIKTTDPDAYRFQIVGESGPELVKLGDAGLIHPDGRAWTVGE